MFSCLKPRRIRWAGQVARMVESKSAYRVLVGKYEGKSQYEKHKRKWEDNIKIDLLETE
jgi:hypothetical protein